MKRERELRKKLQSLQTTHETDRSAEEKQLVKRHESELKGLVKQIQYLRAKCTREENFRSDLVFMKEWFVMQVKMYHRCNLADLELLEEMGITPDISFREKKHSLRTVGQAVIACVRMRKMREAWGENKKLHESLMKKLESMKKTQGRVVGR